MLPEDDAPPVVPPRNEFRRVKAASRSIFHFVHLIMALMLSFALFMDVGLGFSNPFIFYLTPVIFLIFSTDIPYLFCCSPPVFITSRLGIFNTLRGRGFIYQCSAALIWAHAFCGGILFGFLGSVVWVIGFVLFLLGVHAHGFGFEYWMEPVRHDTPESINLSPSTPIESPFHPRKNVIRYITHIIHLFIVFLFLTSVVLLIASGRLELYATIIYIIPVIVVIIAIELCHLRRRTPPERLTSPLGALNSLWGRGFIYQASGALFITNGRVSGCDYYAILPGEVGWRGSDFRDARLDAAWLLGIMAWGIGIVMFICGILVSAYKLNDWVEEPKKHGIRLEDAYEEEANVGLL